MGFWGTGILGWDSSGNLRGKMAVGVLPVISDGCSQQPEDGGVLSWAWGLVWARLRQRPGIGSGEPKTEIPGVVSLRAWSLCLNFLSQALVSSLAVQKRDGREGAWERKLGGEATRQRASERW